MATFDICDDPAFDVTTRSGKVACISSKVRFQVGERRDTQAGTRFLHRCSRFEALGLLEARGPSVERAEVLQLGIGLRTPVVSRYELVLTHVFFGVWRQVSLFLFFLSQSFFSFNVLLSRRHVDIWGDRTRDWVVLGNEIAAFFLQLVGFACHFLSVCPCLFLCAVEVLFRTSKMT